MSAFLDAVRVAIKTGTWVVGHEVTNNLGWEHELRSIISVSSLMRDWSPHGSKSGALHRIERFLPMLSALR